MSLKTRFLAGLLFLVATMGLVLTTALSLPQTDWHFSLNDTQDTLLAHDGQMAMAAEVVAFSTADQQWLASPWLGLEEPDVVPTYVDFNTLMQQQTALHQALLDDNLVMTLADGSQHSLRARARTLADLPGMFWLQLSCGASGLLICLLVLAPRPDHASVRAFSITGLAYLMFTCAAAVYSTRNLLIDGDLFRFLSFVNHTGAMLFSAALTSLLWNYPKRIGGQWVNVLAYSTFVLCVLVDTQQWVEGPATGSYIWVFGLFLFGLIGSGVQWWKARHRPIERGAVRWVLLSIYSGTFFFAGGMLLPAIMQVPPPASQGLLFTTFLLMYAGLALGVVRYRLFELERWWLSIWAWFLGGVAVVVVDLLLASMLTLSNASILALATAIVGWLYFPVRQWCWKHLINRRAMQPENWLPEVAPLLVGINSLAQLEDAWRLALQTLFQPLAISAQPAQGDDNIRITEDGAALRVPALTANTEIVLGHVQQGRRLFTADDVRNAGSLLSLVRVVQNALDAREQGIYSERDRIRQDIHDDLGAKLLTMLHRASEEPQRALVRDALNDLRDLLRSMESGPVSLTDAVSVWEQEARQRCEARNIRLNWHSDCANVERVLSAEQYGHLTRVLRESITNSLRHAEPTRIAVHIRCDAQGLQLDIDNDGHAVTTSEPASTGRGTQIIRHRTQQLGGQASITRTEQLWRVQIAIPLV